MNIKLGKLLLAAAALAGVATGAFAQGQGGGGGRGQGGGFGGPLGMYSRADTNSDGKVSLAELEASRAQQFARYDTDGNGSISFAELDAMAAQRPQMQSRIDALKAADANGDKALSPDEFKAAADAEFKKVDTNGDGFIDATEAAAAMPQRPAQ
jgi:Ca2+-binding EF-hand superfamily protein